MRQTCFSGMTLVELLLSMGLIAMVFSMALTSFVSGKTYYVYGRMRLDSQTATRRAAGRLTREIQESSREGIKINASRNAVLLISARDSQGQFQIYTGLEKEFRGQPYWQKWVMYGLEAEQGSSFPSLIRKEGNPYSSPLPNPDLSKVVSSVSGDWESVFRAAPVPDKLVAEKIEVFDIEDIHCGDTGQLLYIQIIGSDSFGGEKTRYNPGDSVPFTCQGKAGYWIGVTAKN